MQRHAAVSSAEAEWTIVSRKYPCRVCGGHDRCRTGFGDQFACCARHPSDWPLTTGGWLHRLEVSLELEIDLDAKSEPTGMSVPRVA
jgi:hypothetical protein